MKVVEKFVSINGEGSKAGQLAVFVRFAGCNLDCVYCDTKWANEENVSYSEMSKEEIYEYIKNTGIKNITVTGGEPLLQDGIYEFLEYLSLDKELYVEIETNGSVDISLFKKIDNTPSFTMDYKLDYSNMENKMFLDNLKKLDKRDVIKFVSGSQKDLEILKNIVEKYNLIERTKVYVSPVFGAIEPSVIVDWMIENNLNGMNLQIQMHKIIWDPEKKGV